VGDTRYFQFDTILSILPLIFTFDTVDTILFSIPILNKSEASIQDKHVDKYTHTYTQINYSKVLVQEQEHVNMSKNMSN